MSKKFHRCVGLELAGAKSRRSSLVVLDYYPDKSRLVLTDVQEGLREDTGAELLSPDELLIAKLTEIKKAASHFAGLGVHGPLSFPTALDAAQGKKIALGLKTKDPESQWLFETWQKLDPQPRPFVPYLQRPCEVWLRYCTQEKFLVSEAFGANAAPLAARLRVLKPYLPQPIYESVPRAIMSRVTHSLGMPKWIAAQYSDVEKGVKSREEFLAQWLKRFPQVFIYDHDHDSLVTHLACFNAFLSALNQFLHLKEYCENPPRTFPKRAAWIPIPRTVIPWEKLFR